MKCKNCATINSKDAIFCGQCGQKIEKESKQKDKIKNIILSITYITIFIIALGVSKYLTKDLFFSPKKEKIINEVVEKLKYEMNVPSQLDNETIITDITAQPNAIRYHYTLSNIDTNKISNEFIKNFLEPKICGNADTKNLLNQDIGMEYLYTVKETNQSYLVVFNKIDCQ